jgi:cysteine desulfurase
MIYLDNNATTPVAPEVANAMDNCLRENFGNPSSSHSYGVKAKKAVETARKQVAGLVGAKTEEIIFTSGGTEANNMALIGTAIKYKSGHIIASCIEHPSVMNPLKYLESLGFRVTYIPVNKHGRVAASDVLRNINEKTILITIMHSNNETGSIQPGSSIGKVAKNIGITFHCDAAQSVGKVPVNVRSLNVNFLTIVSHKFYGPKGVGALYIKNGTTIKPLMYGASHEHGLRPGTENVAGIVGLGKASSLAKKELPKRVDSMKHLSQLLYDELLKSIPGVKLNGHSIRRLPNTLNLSFPNVSGAVLLSRMKNEIAVSTGSACHAGKHTPSDVLTAMGVSDSDALSSLRISLGRTNTVGQIKKAAKVIVRAYRSF